MLDISVVSYILFLDIVFIHPKYTLFISAVEWHLNYLVIMNKTAVYILMKYFWGQTL